MEKLKELAPRQQGSASKVHEGEIVSSIHGDGMEFTDAIMAALAKAKANVDCEVVLTFANIVFRPVKK